MPDARDEQVAGHLADGHTRLTRKPAVPRTGPQIVSGVTIRLDLPRTSGHHHVPVMLSPNAFSAWWSA